MVTMGLSRTVSEINGDFSRKAQLFPPQCILRPQLMGFALEFVIGARSQKTRMMALPVGRNVLT